MELVGLKEMHIITIINGLCVSTKNMHLILEWLMQKMVCM